MHDYPAEIPIRVLDRPLNHTVRVPGSKSITNRALVIAALAGGDNTLRGALACEDTSVMLDSLKRLGFAIEVNGDDIIIANRSSRHIPVHSADLFVANSGTTMRFLTALTTVDAGHYRLDGVARMRERPIQDLLDALNGLGAKASCEMNNGCPPVISDSVNGLHGGRTSVKSNISSQFLSAILMAAPLADNDVILTVPGEIVSEPYVEMTVKMLHQWHYEVFREGNTFHIPKRECWNASLDYEIEPDASAASYFFAAAAIGRGSVLVQGMKPKMLQGDVRFVECLEFMGCCVDYLDDGIRVSFDPLGRTLTGVDIDMNAISDTVMTLAAVACFADSPTTIRNVAHIRHKETDRIAALAKELRKLGVEVEEYPDGLKITPRPMNGCALDTYNDHRMAMSLALIGLKVPGVVIRNPGCVAKTYPGFWQDFAKLYDSAS